MNGSGGVVRVLLVDDEPMLRTLLRLMLRRSGRYEVVGEAGDGREAIEVASSTLPDVVLLDLSMPRMDGLEALPHLRVQVPDAMVIVFSGFATDGAAAKVREAGAVGYLEKGLDPAALMAAIDDLTGGVTYTPEGAVPPRPPHDRQGSGRA